MADKSKTPIWKSKVVIISGLFIGIVVAYTGFKYASGSGQPQNNTSMASAVNSTKGIKQISGVGGSDNYNNEAEQYNIEKAKEAKLNGQSFISSISGKDKAQSMAEVQAFPASTPVDRTVSKTYSSPIVINSPIQNPKTQEAANEAEMLVKQKELNRQLELARLREQARLEEMQRQRNIKENNKLAIANREKQVESIFAEYINNDRLSNKVSEHVVLISNEETQRKAQELADKAIAEKTDVKKGGKDKSTAPLFISPGDVFYAANKIAINSDFSAADGVMAEIVSPDPKLNHTKFFGSFEYKQSSILLRFNSYRLPDGSTHSVKAYAISETDVTTAVKTSVDSHGFERWGLFIAGSLLEGVSEVVSNRSNAGTTVVYDNTGNPVGESSTGYKYDPGEEAAIVVGKVAEKSSGELQKNLDRPTTVLLDYNQTIGIIILN